MQMTYDFILSRICMQNDFLNSYEIKKKPDTYLRFCFE